MSFLAQQDRQIIMSSYSGIAIFKQSGYGSGVSQTIRVTGSPHVIEVDAYPAFGGKDAAPSPLAYVLAGLISCSQVTAQLVARELGLSLGQFNFDVEAALPTDVLTTGAEGNPNFTRVVITARVETDAAAGPFARLQAETERRCPIFQLFRRSGVEITGHWTAVAPASRESAA